MLQDISDEICFTLLVDKYAIPVSSYLIAEVLLKTWFGK